MKPAATFLLLMFLTGQTLLSGAQVVSAQQSTPANASGPEGIPTVNFCDMVRQPTLYFDKLVRLTVVMQLATEASYLEDADCPLKHDERIGAAYAPADEKERADINRKVRRIREREYGSRAVIRVVGALRNKSRRGFALYRYQFEIEQVEEVTHLVNQYTGELQVGKTYLAAVRGDGRGGLTLVPPLRMPAHQAARFEWTNLRIFPALTRLIKNGGERKIVFSVIGEEFKHITPERWNRDLSLKILRLEE